MDEDELDSSVVLFCPIALCGENMDGENMHHIKKMNNARMNSGIFESLTTIESVRWVLNESALILLFPFASCTVHSSVDTLKPVGIWL